MTDATYDTDDPYGLGYEQGLEGEVQVMDCLTTITAIWTSTSRCTPRRARYR